MKRVLVVILALAACLISQTVPELSTLRLDFPLPDLQKVQQASVSVVGRPSGATYYYWLVANNVIGNASPAGPFIAYNAPVILDSSNYVTVRWTLPTGAVSVDLLRTSTSAPPSAACGCAVATGISGQTSYNDQTNSLSAYTVNTFDPGTVDANWKNVQDSAGVSKLLLSFNETPFAYWDSTGDLFSHSIERVLYADPSSVTELGAQLTALIADLPSTGGIVRVPTGSYTLSTTVSIPQGVTVQLDGTQIAAHTCPAFTLTGEGSTLEGMGSGSEFGGPSTIQAHSECSTATTSAVVNSNIGAGDRGGAIRDLRIDGNNYATYGVIYGASSGGISQNYWNQIQNVSILNVSKGIGIAYQIGTSSNDLWIDHVLTDGVTTCVDLSGGEVNTVWYQHSKCSATTHGVIVGPNSGAYAASDIHVIHDDIEDSATAATPIDDLVLVQNAQQVEISGNRIETQNTALGSTFAGPIVLGTSTETAGNVTITGNNVIGDNHSEHAVVINNADTPFMVGNTLDTVSGTFADAVNAPTGGYLFGNTPSTGGPVNNVSGFNFIYGDPSTSAPGLKTTMGYIGAAGTAAFYARETGDTHDRFDLFNSGALQFGSGSAAPDVSLSRAGSSWLELGSGQEFTPSSATGQDLGDSSHRWELFGNNLNLGGYGLINSAAPEFLLEPSSGTNYNFMLAAQQNYSNGFELSASSTVGGGTYSNNAFRCVASSGTTGACTFGWPATMPSLTIGSGPAMSNPPELLWPSFDQGPLTNTIYLSAWTPTYPITVRRIEASVGTTAVGCTASPVVTVSNGTATQTLTIANGSATSDTGAIAVNFAAGTQITAQMTTAAAGCTTSPAQMNLVIAYTMQ